MYINTAFCFDHNLVRQVQVAAASLLDHRGSAQTHYHIYSQYRSSLLFNIIIYKSYYFFICFYFKI